MDKRGCVLARAAALAHHSGMPRPTQPDLFGDDGQADLFGEAEVPAYRPDLDKVRARLNKLLAEARVAESLPSSRALLLRTIFPHMTSWLPEEEGAQLRLEFDKEMERLKAADSTPPPERGRPGSLAASRLSEPGGGQHHGNQETPPPPVALSHCHPARPCLN